MNAVAQTTYTTPENVARDLLNTFDFGDRIPRDTFDKIIERHGGFASDNAVERSADRHTMKVEVNKIGKAEMAGINIEPAVFFQLEYFSYKGSDPTNTSFLCIYDRDQWILRDLKKKAQEASTRNKALVKNAKGRLEEAETTKDHMKIASCMSDLAITQMMGEFTRLVAKQQGEQLKLMSEQNSDRLRIMNSIGDIEEEQVKRIGVDYSKHPLADQ